MVPRQTHCPFCDETFEALPPRTLKALLAWMPQFQPEAHEDDLHVVAKSLLSLVDADLVSILLPFGTTALRVLASSDRESTGDLIVDRTRHPELIEVLNNDRAVLIAELVHDRSDQSVCGQIEDPGAISLVAVPASLQGTPTVLRVTSCQRRFTDDDLTSVSAAAHLLEHATDRQPTPKLDESPAIRLALKLADAVLDVTPDGRVERAFGLIEENFGVPAASLQGKALDDLIGETTRGDAVHQLLTLLEGQHQEGGSAFQITLPGATPSSVRLWGTRVPGIPSRAIIAARRDRWWFDARRRKSVMQEALSRQARELDELQESLNRLGDAQNRFLSASAHELKTPLSVIQSYLETLLSDLSEGLSKEQLTFLETAYSSAQRLRHLVVDIVDLAALESGSLSMEIDRVDAQEVVSNLVDEMKEMARKAGVNLEHEELNDLPHLRADSVRLEQVLRNLLDNSIKYTQRGGRVWLHGGYDADTVTLCVSDTGRGIDFEELPTVFEQFVRGRPHHNGPNPEGSGLGLAICRRIVGSLGGTIWVTSEEGKGTTFSVGLPRWPDDGSLDEDSDNQWSKR
ncbi:MAG: GAF domain-containing sensor histidine kinase [bacterium]|nr:GAF domain-containing sensor histidine kinase [bacterium]